MHTLCTHNLLSGQPRLTYIKEAISQLHHLHHLKPCYSLLQAAVSSSVTLILKDWSTDWDNTWKSISLPPGGGGCCDCDPGWSLLAWLVEMVDPSDSESFYLGSNLSLTSKTYSQANTGTSDPTSILTPMLKFSCRIKITFFHSWINFVNFSKNNTIKTFQRNPTKTEFFSPLYAKCYFFLNLFQSINSGKYTSEWCDNSIK